MTDTEIIIMVKNMAREMVDKLRTPAKNASPDKKRMDSVIKKIEDSTSEDEIKKIVAAVDQVQAWTSEEKATIKYHANRVTQFLKEHKKVRDSFKNK